MDRDGMRIDELESTLDELERAGHRPKFIYTVPNFHNPAGVTLSLERRHELVRIASERELLVLEDNPYGLLRYEGAPLPTLRSLDEDFVIYASTFSKILSPGVRLGWTAAPAPVLAKMNLGKQSSDLCSSSISQYFVSAYFDSGPWEDYVRSLIEIYRRRRDVMLDALAEHFPREAEWTHPQGGLFIWATLPDYIDTTDLLARALEEHVAFVPGRAAFVDGRGGSSMRLNFSGVSEDEIREGVRRIGEVVREQVALYGTLTGTPVSRRRTARLRARSRRPPAPAPPIGARGRCEGPATAAQAGVGDSRRGAQGRSLARAPGVAEVGGARRGRARAARPRRDPDRRRRRPGRPPDRRAPRRRVRRAPRPRRRGRHRAGAARGDGDPLHRLGRVGLHPRGRQGAHQARDARRRDPDSGLLRVQRDRVPRARRRAGAARDRGAAPVPDRRQAGRAGVGARDQVRPDRRGRPGGADRRVLVRPQGAARALRRRPRPGGLDPRRGRRAARAADRRGGTRAGGLLRLRGALRDRPHAVRLPGRARRRRRRRARRRSRSRCTRCSAARLRARRPDARVRHRRAVRARGRTRSRG